MPDKIKPLKERVNELTTQITSEIHEKFKHIINRRERDTKMIDYLGKELALARAKLEIYQNKK